MMIHPPKIWQPSNIYPTAIISEGVSIGAFTEIGHEVYVGPGTRIGAHCFIPEGVWIGKNCFVAPCVVMTNDRFPPSPRDKWEKTFIEDGASIGAGTVIRCGVTIGMGAKVGCGSVVTKSIPPGEIWCGVPARKMKAKKK